MTDPEINALLWKVGIFSAAVAALVGGLFQFLNGWRERVAEKHRQTREIAAKLALEYWKRRMEVEDAKKAGQELTIKSLNEQLRNMVGLVDELAPAWWGRRCWRWLRQKIETREDAGEFREP